MARRRPTEPAANPTRGAILVVVAVVLGLFLLRNGLDTTEAVRASNDDRGSQRDDEQAPGEEGDGEEGETTETTVPVRAPAEVPTVVLNGTNVAGVAGRFNDHLAAAGYPMGTPANASPKVDATAVYFLPGYDREAAAVAAAIGAPETAVAPLPATVPGEIGGAQVVVVIGADLAAVGPPAAG
jgi:hypothetical protein